MLSAASVEVSSRGHELPALKDRFAAGTDVTITFLPGDNCRHNVDTATALRRAGFTPVPHLAAREIASKEVLNDFIARLRGAADVRRVLLIAGDVAGAKGPFKSSQRCRRDRPVAGARHLACQRRRPSGRPSLSGRGAILRGAKSLAGLDAADQYRPRYRHPILLRGRAPILSFLAALNARGIKLPVTIGLAGPATPATLTKFALRCGIGNSIRALRGQIGRCGRLLVDRGPDEVMRDLTLAPTQLTQAIAGFHIFPFGGLRKAHDWLRAYPEAACQPAPPLALKAHPNP
jgi:methylenetetrahydrofolate reductase (NADPH)